MTYDSGFTPVPPNSTSPYSDPKRQESAEILKEIIDKREASFQDGQDDLEVLRGNCNRADCVAGETRRIAYEKNHELSNLLADYKKCQDEIRQLQYEKYKAGGSSSKLDKEILKKQMFMTQTFDQYTLQEIQAGLADHEKMSARFAQIQADNDFLGLCRDRFNEALEIGDLKNQLNLWG